MYLSEVGVDGRKIALLFWIVITIGFLIVNRSSRKTVASLIKTLIHPKVSIIFTLAATYSGAVIVFLERINYWNLSMLADSIIWFFGTAVIFMMNLGELADISKFTSRLKTNFSFILVLEFFTNLYSFNAIIEILLFPILALVAGVATLASLKKEQYHVAVLANIVLSFVGFIFIIWSGISLIKNIAITSGSEVLINLSVVPLLTIVFLPFVYGLGIYSGYDSLFVSIDHYFSDNRTKRTALKLLAIKECLINYWAIDKFRKNFYLRFFADKSI